MQPSWAQHAAQGLQKMVFLWGEDVSGPMVGVPPSAVTHQLLSHGQEGGTRFVGVRACTYTETATPTPHIPQQGGTICCP